MRVLHLVKTSDGAPWAALQAAELVRQGVEVHVALPSAEGATVAAWRAAEVTLHVASVDLPAKEPWRLGKVRSAIRSLVRELSPDLIHSHFFGTTVALRMALGADQSIPRVFQVPGPLHMEHRLFRALDLATAGRHDFWIGSSECVVRHYEAANVNPSCIFLSYYGVKWQSYQVERTNRLRSSLGIPNDAHVVGNINWIYPPKRYLGQTVGLKCHEDVIDALGMAIRERPKIHGVLVGGVWGNAPRYERSLHLRAKAAGGPNIHMPGALPHTIVREAWPDFDCAVHVPLSENCGGVVEPLLAGVPTIAGRIGGLPELVIDGVTGRMVRVRHPEELAMAILETVEDIEEHRRMARRGQVLARRMFDVRRTAREVHQIYRHLLAKEVPPERFRMDPTKLIDERPDVTGRPTVNS